MLLRVLLAMVAVFIVGYPLVRGERDLDDDESAEEAADLYHRKESAYAALKELEFDYRTGKLSEDDYRELEAKYRTEGLEVLEAIEAYESGEPLPESFRLDAETHDGACEDDLDAEEEDLEPAMPPGYCAECGEQNPRKSAFCRECGSSLVPVVPSGAAV